MPNEFMFRIKTLLDGLTEEDLQNLNRLVVEKLKLLHKARSLKAMAEFNLADRVYFHHGQRRIIGTVIRLNQKTVSVETNDGHHWTIPPAFLRKMFEADAENF